MSLRPADPSKPGLNYSFSERIRAVLALAVDAARLRGDMVRPGHVFLGLLQLGEGTAWTVLEGLEVDPGEIIKRIEQSLGSGNAKYAWEEPVPFTEAAGMALHLALAEAREHRSTYVGTEHLLLGLLRQDDSLARDALNSVGVSHEKAQAETLRVWDSEEGFV